MIDSDKLAQALFLTNQKLATLDPIKRSQLENSLANLTPIEIVKYQELKGIAHVEGRISLDVAMWCYNTINSWDKTPLADRIIFSQLIGIWLGVIHK